MLLDPTTVALAGIPLLVLIIMVIEAAKKFFPAAPGKVWLAAALVLGATGQILARLIAEGMPGTLEGWTALIVLGLFVGLSASKLYDETLRAPNAGAMLTLELDPAEVDLEFTDSEVERVARGIAAKLPAYLDGSAYTHLSRDERSE